VSACRPLFDRGAHTARQPPEAEVVGRSPAVDLVRAERAVAEVLAVLGQDPTSEELAETPRRVAASYAELLTPAPFTLTSFPNDSASRQPVPAPSPQPCTACCAATRARDRSPSP
jgi:hypothetical protein